ncbi:MAG: hypothetical protein GEV28_19040 [Actinophytocola sp.]|uniref:hypothetical protein n=1 Tax=Actinophytocola sp. TaxID=1872138 RepID=UPI0013217E57|nr:hypothetical protein [Actinophytocola sp.]MPZ82375.1 hypothetical protein [Actinophytocola sp.]
MDFAHLSNDRLNETGAYLAAAEAACRTRHTISLKADDRRWLLTVNGKKARVFARRFPTERPLRRATDQDVDGVHAVIFVDLTTSSPGFYVAPPEHTTAGLVEQHRDEWERFD